MIRGDVASTVHGYRVSYRAYGVVPGDRGGGGDPGGVGVVEVWCLRLYSILLLSHFLTTTVMFALLSS